MTEQLRPRITLALSSGITLTMAHVGVLQALEEARIPIDGIAATSGGAMVAALYAGGMTLPEMRDIAMKVGWRDFSDLRLPRMGFFSNAKIERFLEAQIGPKTFRDLAFPLAIICTNLTAGEEVILREGSVARAVRATCSIPQLFTPVEDNGRLLCDGGVLNKIPVQAARDLEGDIVIAVDVGARSRQVRVPTNLLGITAKVMSLIAEDRAERERGLADVLLTPDLSAYGGYEFGQADQVIAIGRAEMEAQLPALERCIAQWHAGRTWHGRLQAWWRGAAA